jgi:putative endonuclease
MKVKQLNHDKGKQGEKLALDFLLNKGMRLVEVNFRTEIGEIDLIMADKDWLVFVEVKYKQDGRLGLPEEMIGSKKISQVRRVAEGYLMIRGEVARKFKKYRLDAVCIMDQQIHYYQSVG